MSRVTQGPLHGLLLPRGGAFLGLACGPGGGGCFPRVVGGVGLPLKTVALTLGFLVSLNLEVVPLSAPLGVSWPGWHRHSHMWSQVCCPSSQKKRQWLYIWRVQVTEPLSEPE